MNRVIRYQRRGTRHLRLRPGEVDHPGATGQRVGDDEGTQADAEHRADHPVQREGRSNGKICESTIGGIADTRRPAPSPITMNATTGRRATARTTGDVTPLLNDAIAVASTAATRDAPVWKQSGNCFYLKVASRVSPGE